MTHDYDERLEYFVHFTHKSCLLIPLCVPPTLHSLWLTSSPSGSKNPRRWRRRPGSLRVWPLADFLFYFFFHFVHFTCTLSSFRTHTHTHVNTYELPGFHAYLNVTSYVCVKTRGVKSQITSNSFLPEGIITGAFPAERMFTCSISAKYLHFVPSSISLLNDYVETRAVLGEVYKWCLCSLAVWNPMLYSAATKSKH